MIVKKLTTLQQVATKHLKDYRPVILHALRKIYERREILKYSLFPILFVLFISTLFFLRFDVEQYRQEISQAVTDRTGRDFSINGDLRLALSLTPTLIAEDIIFANSEWSKTTDMVTISFIEAEFSLLALLGGTIQIGTITLHEPKIFLELNSEGQGNWLFNNLEADSANIGSDLSLNIHDINVRNAQLTFQDGQYQQDFFVTADEFNLHEKSVIEEKLENSNLWLLKAKNTNITIKKGDGIELSMHSEDLTAEVKKPDSLLDITGFSLRQAQANNGNFSLNDKHRNRIYSASIEIVSTSFDGINNPFNINMKGLYKDKKLQLNGSFHNIESLINNKTLELDSEIKLDDSSMKLSGKIDAPHNLSDFDLSMEFNTDNLKTAADIIEIKLPFTGKTNITTQVTGSKSGYQVKKLKTKIGESDVSGDIILKPGIKKTYVAANLFSKNIHIKKSNTPLEKDKIKKVLLSGKEIFSFKQFGKLNVDLSLHADNIFAHDVHLKESTMTASLKNGHMKAEIKKTVVAGGEINGFIELKPVSASAMALLTDIKAQHLHPALIPALKKKRFINNGKTDISLNAAGEGDSLDNILADLNGNLLVHFQNGRIYNSALDFSGSDLLFVKEGEFTDLQCGVVKMEIENGIARTKKQMAMETPNMVMVGSGTVDLKNGQLNLSIKPDKKTMAPDASKLAKYVRIGGTVFEPKPVVNAAETAKTAARVGAAIATGGLSFLAELVYGSVTKDREPCARILES